MNKKGQDAQGIIGLIVALILVVGFVLPMISLIFSSGSQMNEKQKEINTLTEEKATLSSRVTSLEGEVAQLKAMINSMNQSISQKDELISNLTGQINDRDQIIQNLTNELTYYSEKTYLQRIENYFNNTSNYYQNIENRFFPIEISLSVLSLTLFTVVFKVFSLEIVLKKLWERIKSKKEKKPEGPK